MNAVLTQSSRHHAGKEFLTQPAQQNHIVQFYEAEDFLYDVVADFMGAGLGAGEPLIIIATQTHRDAFVQRLETRGYEVASARSTGQLTLLDARETLAQFMVDGLPDAMRFNTVVGKVLTKSQSLACHARIRAYGEMVDLLWQDGLPDAAIRLEELWNELGRLRSFSLLCAYRMGAFGKDAHEAGFRHVCQTHSHVIPTEKYSELHDPDARLREVSLLQQRALALEAEIDHRKQVESSLRDAVAARDDFLAIAGHELKTPLTAIKLQTQSVLRMALDEDASRTRERVEKIAQQVTRLSTLIDDLLDVSRISAGRFALELERFDLTQLVRDGVERARDVATRPIGPINLVTDGPLEGTWDRLRVEQVVTNLLTNAIKYGKDGAIEVRLSATSDRARLIVRDSGLGVPLGDQTRIFERFERAVSSHHYGGLGLGLWISRKIVEAHRGTIHVESQVGEGAAFIVELPLEMQQ